MELQATVINVLPLESGTSKAGKQWSKASVVVQTDGQYPRKILLSNFKDAQNFAALQNGQRYNFHIEVESRDWTNPNTGKVSWFTEVTCWKWDSPMAMAMAQTQQVQQPMAQPANQYEAFGMPPRQTQMQTVPGTDDLPF